MHSQYASFALLTLLASNAFAASYDEEDSQKSTSISSTSKTSNLNKTVVVTVTQTSYTTEGPSPALSPSWDNPSYTSALAVPPPPDSVQSPPPEKLEPDHSVPTTAAPTLVCPHPIEPCTLDGITIWPFNTTSLVLPSFGFEPLPTTMASDVSPGIHTSLTTETLGTSGSPTSASTTCPHSMSHIVPGKSTTLVPPTSNMYGNPSSESDVLTSTLTGVPTGSMVTSISTTCSHSMSHIVPGKSDVSIPPVPTESSTAIPGPPLPTTPLLDTPTSQPTLHSSTGPGPPYSDNVLPTPIATSGSPTYLSSTDTTMSTTSPSSMPPIVPGQSTISAPVPVNSFTSAKDAQSSMPAFTWPHPQPAPAPTQPPSTSDDEVQVRDVENSASLLRLTTAEWQTEYIKHTKTRRTEESKATKPGWNFWGGRGRGRES
ncbi:hypothetical protein BDW02DRAFT_320471 [Decorospora gaudefroyi]|uniref:Uncharacterized protein n=1 Tax=Decorospora gaudefroyi TaxID=184978 RepID=A0A6A5KKF5_9PLEO|nr:hypothetical protein BDW02DRAFT_320471 [Decorospora gaudefroyi]